MEQNTKPEISPIDSSAVPKPKKNTGLILGMVACVVLAVAGVGFGVWGIIKVNELHNDTSQTDTDNQPGADDDEGGIHEGEMRKNPIISATPPKYYGFGFTSSSYSMGEQGEYSLTLSVRDGLVNGCTLNKIDRDWVENGAISGFVTQTTIYKTCDGVDGLSGKIYKVVLAGEGQDAGLGNVAFIMEDGTVEYFPIKDAIESSVPAIKGKLGIDGFVVDAFTVNVGEDHASGGYATTIFVLSDGSYINYSDTMLK